MSRYKLRRPSRRMTLFTGLFLGAGMMSLGAAAQEPPQWTLPEALKIALANSPAFRAKQARVHEVASHLVNARTYPYNPDLALELADRDGPGTSATDHNLSLSQEIEVAGQRGKRIAVAHQELAAAEALLSRDGQLLVFQVESAFAEAVRARELLTVAETDAALAREVLRFSLRRLERGAATQIEVNLAQASSGRAERSLQRGRAAYASARGRLAEVTGTRPTLFPEPIGDLALPEGELRPLEELLESAFENRGDLASIRRQERAAEAAIELALAERRPNLKVEGFVGQEEGVDDIIGAAVGVSVPLFNRNQGRIAETRAVRERLGHERAAMLLAIEQEVTTSLEKLRASRKAAEYLRDEVLGTLEENVDLLQRSYEAGRIGAIEVVTLRREFVDSRRELIEALADAWLARIDLDLAVGRASIPLEIDGKEKP